ncbi:MAG TPA: helix-hairpin-helix domain-containing protein [Candidatus Nanoarchaeia archaeon]
MINWRKNKLAKNILRQVQKFQTSIILAFIGLALIGAGLSIAKFISSSEEPKFIPAEEKTKVEDKILVDIEGAIKTPGLHKLSSDARMDDVIRVAGGLTNKADKGWIAKNLNLASKLTDGQKIYIPMVGETNVDVATGQVASEISGKININTASEAQLDTLPGIGPARAGDIIANRPYKSIDEVLSKGAVGEKTFEKIKDQITVQ